MRNLLRLSAVLAGVFVSTALYAQVRVGLTLSTTGPAASLGIPEQNTATLLPREIGGQKIDYIILNDASDTTVAVKNTHKLINEDKVDAIIGSTITTNSLAMIDTVGPAGVPMISVAASKHIVSPMDANRHWVYKTVQNDSLLTESAVRHMAAHGVKTVAYIGFSDGYGDSWLQELTQMAEKHHIKVVANERYGRTDSSVTGIVLKAMATKPDAVFIGASGTPGALPQMALVERGYKGKIYQTQGVANQDFLRVCGKSCEGTLIAVGPAMVAAQLPDSHPAKAVALDYIKHYEAKYGAGTVSPFGAHVWDAGRLLQRAIPLALKQGKPGTKEFRSALRDALEQTKDLAVANGVLNMTAQDHAGFDARAVAMIRIEGGKWKLVPTD